MLKIKKILLPLDLEESVLPVVVVHQAAALAHHFHSEILVLHVITPLTYIAGKGTIDWGQASLIALIPVAKHIKDKFDSAAGA
jgi:hypothetical protein